MPGQFSTSDSPSALISSPFSWGPGPVQPLCFRTRTEVMNWRRLSSLDVERVAREMDVSVLQEFISEVTFCDITGERCPHCRNSADPALLKVLRMSQLSTEYLLHCQDYLIAQVSGLEDRLQGALSRADREGEERARLDAELQATRQESRRRKKMIASQQLLLQASSNNYHKCQFCEKSFINYSYLQAHLQRRHPEITDAERQKKRQVEQVEDGIEELRERLKLAQTKLETEREAEALRKQQELELQQRKEVSEQIKLENWKEEERFKFQEEMRGLKQLFLQEFKDMSSKNSSIEAKLQELQTREVAVSNQGSSFQDEDKLQQRERELKERMAQQKSEWRKRFKEIQNRHLQETEELQSENERLKHALSADHSSGLQQLQQHITSLSTQMSQKEKLIRSQEKKIKKLSVRPVPVSDTPIIQAVKHTTVEDEEVDLEEEEKSQEDSGETRQRLLESLHRNPSLVNEFRPILEETLEERLEKIGLRKGVKGISQKTYKSLISLVSGQRQQKSRQVVNLLELRESLSRELTLRVRRLQKSQSTPIPTPQAQKKRSYTSPTQERSPKCRHTLVKTSTVKREKVQATQSQQTSSAHRQKNCTPPFSSEEESVGDSAYVTSPGSRSAPSVRIVRSGPRQYPISASAEDWSDTELSEGPTSPPARHSHGAQGSVVKSLTRSLERQLSSPVSKPVGGTRVIPPVDSVFPKPKPRTAVKTLQLSHEESDLELSSIEEILPLPLGRLSLGGRGSTDIGGTSGTSIWSSSTGRAGGL